MKIRAAVLRQTGTPLTLETVELDPPADGEVLVKMVSTGVCHTDLSVIEGGIRVPLPIVLGHEGAGIVESVGPRVTSLKPGDHVVLNGAASCGQCPQCLNGKPTLCHVFSPSCFGGMLPGKQRRLHLKNEPINHFFSQSSFAEYSVAPQEVAIKVRDDAPLKVLGPLGCGVTTGLGSVINAAKPKLGASVAVFGCGGVGMSAIMGARLVGAGKIIAVDLLAAKLTMAKKLGATATINAAKDDVVDQIRKMSGGGVDHAIVAVASTKAIHQAIESIAPGGQCVIVGGAPQGTKIDLGEIGILREKTIRGVTMGSGRTALDVPHYVNFFMEGRLPLDKLVTKTYTFDHINDAIEELRQGKVIKPVITFE